MQIPPTCMWLAELSLVRNETSSALSRSMCPCAMRPNLPANAPPRCHSRPAAVPWCSPRWSRGAAATRPVDRRVHGDRARSTPSAPSPTCAAQVEIGPRPRGSPAAHRTAELIAGALHDAGLARVTIQRPWENVARHDPRVGAGHGRRRRPLRHEEQASRASSAPTTAPPGSRCCSSWRARCRDPLAGPSVQLVAFDGEEARGDRRLRRATAPAAAASTSPTPAPAASRARRRSTGSGRWSSSTWSATATCRSRSSRAPTRASTHCSRTRPRQLDGNAGAVSRQTRSRSSDDHTPFLEGRDPGARPDRLRLRPRAAAGRLLAHGRGHHRQVCAAEPRAVGEAALGAIPEIR